MEIQGYEQGEVHYDGNCVLENVLMYALDEIVLEFNRKGGKNRRPKRRGSKYKRPLKVRRLPKSKIPKVKIPKRK